MDENIILDNRVAAPPQPRRSPGSNSRQRRLARLRQTALDKLESPLDRLEAARQILKRYGISDRNIPIIRRVLKDCAQTLDGDQIYRVQKIKLRLVKLLQLKKVKLPADLENTEIEIAADSTDIRAIAQEPEMLILPDTWDLAPALPQDEQSRLIDCHRSLLRGRALLESALAGRAMTIEFLLKLYNHMSASFSAGGMALADPTPGSLYCEVKQTLLDWGVILPDASNKKGYGELLLEELNARG